MTRSHFRLSLTVLDLFSTNSLLLSTCNLTRSMTVIQPKVIHKSRDVRKLVAAFKKPRQTTSGESMLISAHRGLRWNGSVENVTPFRCPAPRSTLTVRNGNQCEFQLIGRHLTP